MLLSDQPASIWPLRQIFTGEVAERDPNAAEP